MLTKRRECEWTQATDGEWTQGVPKTRWKTLEESTAILKAIFPNYPSLEPCKPYDGKEEQESELPLADTVV
jgi:hypothetical protein